MSEDVPSVDVGEAREEIVEPQRLREFAHGVLERMGMSSEDARLTADSFVWTELHGLPFVGIRRLPEFVDRIREGGTRPGADQSLTVVQERGAFAVVDAEHTFAQVAGVEAMRLAMSKARLAGVGIVTVRNTTTAGALGYLAMLAAENGMVGMAINNTAPVMSAWGGASGVMGAQPFALASPAGEHPPLLLDMTNTVMSMVRMYESKARDEPIPEGVALDADGRPTTDPAAGIAGTLLPSGHRGYGLAIMWEVLSGILAGGDIFGGDVGLPGELDRPMGVSLFLMAIDPTAAMPEETFGTRVDTLIDHLHDSPTAPGVDAIRVPGERSQATARARREGGIPIPDEVVRSLEKLGSEVGIPW